MKREEAVGASESYMLNSRSRGENQRQVRLDPAVSHYDVDRRVLVDWRRADHRLRLEAGAHWFAATVGCRVRRFGAAGVRRRIRRLDWFRAGPNWMEQHERCKDGYKPDFGCGVHRVRLYECM